ncbi:hypothetical protein EsVE80_07920 [Enterococcus saigonensis]|uniref:Uncharacterized protein n=1 Tax=Enterococcus saigonensis TaxID=1805431 RepID=A0A679IB32_9ENTE|nr:hypothetical protein [Enterococcus saigonensis]BCA85269.1 hypothetical protein EsVE80_07920 [Enterococcus saigonensis]
MKTTKEEILARRIDDSKQSREKIIKSALKENPPKRKNKALRFKFTRRTVY